MGLTLEGAAARSNHFADTANNNIREGKVIIKTNMNDEVNNFNKYAEGFVRSASETFKLSEDTYTEPVAIEVVDNNTEDEVEKTGFYSATFLTSADNMFATPAQETVVEPVDNVSDNTSVIPTLNQEVRPEDSFTAAMAPIEEPNTEEYEGEVVSFEEEKAKTKVKTIGKRAAYVDTVILCLIAQLSIFGLLIIVLLIIK